MPAEFSTASCRAALDGTAEGELYRREGNGNGSEDVWNESGGVWVRTKAQLCAFYRHFDIKATEPYLHVSRQKLVNIISPLDD